MEGVEEEKGMGRTDVFFILIKILIKMKLKENNVDKPKLLNMRKI